ncbi:MAG: hypothetical protein GX786_11095 [Clostridiales bacterium]|nr:hypothetical protein [Clostridiales bacterium]
MSNAKDFLLKCMECGTDYFTEGEKIFYENKGLTMPKRCKPCRDKRRHLFEQIKVEKELEELLPTLPFRQIKMAEVTTPNPDAALFIIGNGFDLMHGIPSSYYNFRDTVGRNNILRFTLENYIRTDDVWGDFENNLAYLDREMMLGTVDDWLDDFNVLDEDDEDFSAADFFAAQEAAVSPVFILTQELPKRFRRWINGLEFNGRSKPLESILNQNARYINFNYTEFLETNYEIPQENILYIHGDRRNRNGELVLGHGHDTERVFEAWYHANKNRQEFQPRLKGRKGRYYNNDNPVYLGYFLVDETKGNWKSQMRYNAINNAVRMIEEYYDDSAKKTNDVLATNQQYFELLESIRNVVVVGHSLSAVDYPYFKEIIKHNENGTELKWQISWYSPEDIRRIQRFLSVMEIPSANVAIFKT